MCTKILTLVEDQIAFCTKNEMKFERQNSGSTTLLYLCVIITVIDFDLLLKKLAALCLHHKISHYSDPAWHGQQQHASLTRTTTAIESLDHTDDTIIPDRCE